MIPMSPNEEQTLINVNQALAEISKTSLFVSDKIPNSRERSIAITKLDEAYMWLNQIAICIQISDMS